MAAAADCLKKSPKEAVKRGQLWGSELWRAPLKGKHVCISLDRIIISSAEVIQKAKEMEKLKAFI